MTRPRLSGSLDLIEIPFNVTVSSNIANTGAGNQRPNLIATPADNCGKGHLMGCTDKSAFATAAQFTYGNAGRNLLCGPGLYNVDFPLFKNFDIREIALIQFRSEVFNFLNTPPFSKPNAVYDSANFGTISSTKHDNRQIQFGLKLVF